MLEPKPNMLYSLVSFTKEQYLFFILHDKFLYMYLKFPKTKFPFYTALIFFDSIFLQMYLLQSSGSQPLLIPSPLG